jgi:hypothetical protein
MNACVAASFGGVIFSYEGECATITAIKNSGGVFSKLQLLPNPAADFVVLSFELLKEALVQVRIKNLLSETIFEIPEEKTVAGYKNISLPVTVLPLGVYLVEISVNGKTIAVKKMIKQ